MNVADLSVNQWKTSEGISIHLSTFNVDFLDFINDVQQESNLLDVLLIISLLTDVASPVDGDLENGLLQEKAITQ